MQISAYTVDGSRFRASSVTAIEEVPPEAVWVDVQSPTHDDAKAIAEGLGLRFELDAQVWDFEVYGHAEIEGDQLTLVLSANAPEIATSEKPGATLIALVDPKRLVTFHTGPLPAIQTAAEELRHTAPGSRPPLQLFIRLMSRAQQVISTTLDSAEAVVRRSAYRLYSGQKKHRAEIDLENLLSELGLWRARLVEVQYRNNFLLRVIALLKVHREPSLSPDLREDLELVEADGVSYRDFGRSVADQLTQLVDATIGYIGIRQNDSARWFSIVATVFMPPTLLAAVWGMNFQYMPELDERIGYGIALVLMFLSATVPLWIVRKKGLLGR